jgi:regulator of RNase E activity RraB
MKKIDLQKIIREEVRKVLKEDINPSKDTIAAYNIAIELDASNMESLFGMLSDYFKRNAEAISNMDAKKIAAHLSMTKDLIKKRTGN